MPLTVLLKIIKLPSLFLGLLLVALFFISFDQSSILIESRESKRPDGGPIFNKISLKKDQGQDIWLMEQSHFGVTAAPSAWDKIAIAVSNKKAHFYQFENGNEPISMHLKKTNFKISCFFCHSSGPRVIRPEWNSKLAPISLWNQARIHLWNLKIKTYGPLVGEGHGSQKAFRHPSPRANQVLNIEACKKCHNGQSFLGRGELTKQNFLAIRFMIENDIMPPPGFSLSQEDKRKVLDFIKL